MHRQWQALAGKCTDKRDIKDFSHDNHLIELFFTRQRMERLTTRCEYIDGRLIALATVVTAF